MNLDDGVVRVRPLEEGDVAAYLGAFRDDPGLANLLGYERTPEEAEVLSEDEWAIADARSDAFLGAIAFHSVDWKNRRGETRFWVVPAARGQGVVSRALALVLDWAFAAGMERMELTALPENTAVPRIAETFGYEFEGTLRQRNFERGRRVDILVWGLLRDEYSRP